MAKARPATEADKRPYRATSKPAARDDEAGAERDARKWAVTRARIKGKQIG